MPIEELTKPRAAAPGPEATFRTEPPLAISGPLGAAGALVIVLVGVLALREVASLLVPVLFGLFLALVASPLIGVLQRRGLGRDLALTCTIGTVLVCVLVAAGIVALSIAELVVLIPRYEDRLGDVIAELRSILAGYGITADPNVIPGILSPANLGSLVQSTASAMSRTAGAILVLAFTMLYALTGAASLQARAEAAFGERHALLEGIERFGVDLRRYLVVRAQLGLFAAVLVFALLLILGVPLPALWSFLTFAASFIPNIGTIIALVPPTVLALLDSGYAAAAAVVVGFTLINIAQDYILQPRMMGTELNVSPLVVFLSVIGWAWILGAAGALLAVPLTVGLLAVLEAFPSSRGLATLMRNKVEPEPGTFDEAVVAGTRSPE